MNKNLILVLNIIFFASFLYSKELPFQAERMITDFNGIVTNGNTVLAYGNYGIITYSENSGQSWEQINIGDKHRIKKMISLEKNYFAISDYSIIKSTDNGLNYRFNDISDNPELVDFFIYQSMLFVLSKTGISIYDLNLKLIKDKLIELDDWYEYNSLETDGKNIYIITDKKNILRYDLSGKKYEMTDLVKLVNPYWDKISKITVNNQKLLALIEMTGTDDGVYSQLVETVDNGDTWKVISPIIRGTDCFKIIENEIYFVKNISLINNSLGLEYAVLDSSHFSSDSSYFTVINPNDSINRYIFNKFKYGFSDFIKIGKDTLIAVGKNKSIAVSVNNGKNWQLKSFFDCYSYSYSDQPFFFVNKDLIYCKQGINKTFYKSTNGGITWLPSILNSAGPNYFLNGGGQISQIFNEKGEGISYFRYTNDSLKKANGNILKTEDFGETYKLYTDSLNVFPPAQSNIIRTDSGYFYFYISEENGITKTNFNFIDSNWKITNFSEIDSITILKFINDKSCIYALGRILTDSTINASSQFYKGKYLLLKSTDNGRKWDKINLDLPFSFISNWIKSPNTYYISDVLDFLQFDNYLLIPFYIYDNSKYLCYNYRINLGNNVIDSLNFSPLFGGNNQQCFTYKDILYSISLNNSFYFNKSFYTNYDDLSKYDSKIINDILFNWNIQEENQLISFWFKEGIGFIASGKKIPVSQAFDPDFALNMIKISPLKITPVEDYHGLSNNSHEINITPNPATDYIEISYSPLEKGVRGLSDEIRIYNVFGQEVYPTPALGATPPYKGEENSSSHYSILTTQYSTRIDVSGLPPGVYFVRVVEKVGKFLKL